MKKIILTLCLIEVSFYAVAQNNKDSLNVINRKYQKEIDVAVQFIGSPGAAFIYKKKDNSGRFIELNAMKNFRFQAALNGHIPVTEKTKIQDTLSYNRISKDVVMYNVQAMVGYEKVKFFGKFSLYYGCDIGAYYTYGRSGYMVETFPYNNGYSSGTTVTYAVTDPFSGHVYGNNYYAYYYQNGSSYAYTPSGSNFYLLREISSIGMSIAPFVGAKYRFSEHLSASIETAFYLNYFFTQVIYSNPPLPIFNSKASTIQRVSGFEFSPKYLRFLTLNYHF